MKMIELNNVSFVRQGTILEDTGLSRVNTGGDGSPTDPETRSEYHTRTKLAHYRQVKFWKPLENKYPQSSKRIDGYAKY